jgi:hypothetical protein
MRLSPSGARVAWVRGFADVPASPRIVVRDLADGAERVIAPGQDPRWLREDVLLWRDQETGEIRQAQAPEWTAERWGG